MIIDRIFLKFILVGGINTLFGSSLMFIMYNIFAFGYWTSSSANYIAGSILSFFLNKYWTFNVRKWSLFIVIVFIANIVISYLVAYKLARIALYYILADYSINVRDNAAMAVGICLFTGLNYIGQRYIVFRKETK
ncbi:MAG: GtrA family protein [Spirochaetaceae bacterium]|nr:GtrA family protein [Spirochaetaceae bacterium]